MDALPHSVLRPQGSDPTSSVRPSVHLRNSPSNRTRATVGLRPNKPPLPPGLTSVYSRTSDNRDLRVTQRAKLKSHSVSNGTRNNDVDHLSVIKEDRSVSLVRDSRHSIASAGYDWLDDDETTVFKVLKC